MPLYHVFGINTLMTSLCMGDACVLLPRFDFSHFLAAIQRYKVSIFDWLLD
jgi:acyl-CoA synthetase (AMP-forming)/AMP-acid ligase II